MPKFVNIREGTCLFSRVEVPGGPIIDRLSISGRGLSVDLQTKRPSSTEDLQVVASLLETDLTAYLNGRLPGPVKKVDVNLRDGKVHVAAIAKVILEIQALAVCRLDIVDEREIHVVLESLEPGGPVRGIVESQLQSVNPVLTADDLPIPVRLTGVQIGQGDLQVLGVAKLEL